MFTKKNKNPQFADIKPYPGMQRLHAGSASNQSRSIADILETWFRGHIRFCRKPCVKIYFDMMAAKFTGDLGKSFIL